MAKTDTVTHDTGSVFHALGLPDADDLQLRSERLMLIGQIIAERGLKQREVRVLLEMSRFEISALMRGRINQFSSERLARALQDLNASIVEVGRPEKLAS
ncbi:helix-turn-helix domain-containing protein [Sphingobium sufflavum]|uniref:helix-turn-helix domain-containing protein n=1 Tax=Sphingobium sufflavum TaxID=1129547 RepID=UPI001F22886D|nr:XRE family transcriptional regulator [Sphingobium sufflavum]MCE7798111.1 helix-turn-helix domain-containing protein [Sphingobium sufflavum]